MKYQISSPSRKLILTHFSSGLPLKSMTDNCRDFHCVMRIWSAEGVLSRFPKG